MLLGHFPCFFLSLPIIKCIPKGEKNDIRKAKTLCLPVFCFMALALVLFQMPAQCQAFDIEIDVSPNVLNIQSAEHYCHCSYGHRL